MAFFRPERLRRKTIEVDESTPNCNSPEMQKRIDRIEQNYAELDIVLGQLESKLEADERLVAIDDRDFDFEAEFGIKPKRKWRPAKPKKKSKKRAVRSKAKSVDPKKPR